MISQRAQPIWLRSMIEFQQPFENLFSLVAVLFHFDWTSFAAEDWMLFLQAARLPICLANRAIICRSLAM